MHHMILLARGIYDPYRREGQINAEEPSVSLQMTISSQFLLVSFHWSTKYFYCLRSCFHWMKIQSPEKVDGNYWFASVHDCFLYFLAERTHLGNGRKYLAALHMQWGNSLRQEVLPRSALRIQLNSYVHHT